MELTLANKDLPSFLAATFKATNVGQYDEFAEKFNANWKKASTYFTMLASSYCTYTAEFLSIIRDNILPLTEDYAKDWIKVSVIYKYLMEYYGETTTRFICPSTVNETSNTRHSYRYVVVQGDVHTGGNIGLLNIFAILNRDGEYLVKDFRELRLCMNVNKCDEKVEAYHRELKRLEKLNIFSIADLVLVTKAIWNNETNINRINRALTVPKDASRENNLALYNTMFPVLYSSNRTFASYINGFLASPFEVLAQEVIKTKNTSIIKELEEVISESVTNFEVMLHEMSYGVFEKGITNIYTETIHQVANNSYLPIRFYPFFPISLMTTSHAERTRKAVMQFQLESGYGRKQFKDRLLNTPQNEVTEKITMSALDLDFEFPMTGNVNFYSDSTAYNFSKPIKKGGKEVGSEIVTNGYGLDDFTALLHKAVMDFKSFTDAITDINTIEGIMSGLVHDSSDPYMVFKSTLLGHVNETLTQLVGQTNRFLTKVVLSGEPPKDICPINKYGNFNSSERYLHAVYLAERISELDLGEHIEKHKETFKEIALTLSLLYYHGIDYVIDLHSTNRNYKRINCSSVTNITSVYPLSPEIINNSVINMLRRLPNMDYVHDKGFPMDAKVSQDYYAAFKKMHSAVSVECAESFLAYLEGLTNEKLIGYLNSRDISVSKTTDVKKSDIFDRDKYIATYLNSRPDVIKDVTSTFASDIELSFDLALESIDKLFELVQDKNCPYKYISN